MNSNLTYHDVVNAVTNSGWKIASQSENTTVVQRRKGANSIAAFLLMAVFSLVGVVVVLIWIGVAGVKQYIIERGKDDFVASVRGEDLNLQIQSRYHLDTFLQKAKKVGMGYGTAILIGIPCIIANAVVSATLLS